MNRRSFLKMLGIAPILGRFPSLMPKRPVYDAADAVWQSVSMKQVWGPVLLLDFATTVTPVNGVFSIATEPISDDTPIDAFRLG